MTLNTRLGAGVLRKCHYRYQSICRIESMKGGFEGIGTSGIISTFLYFDIVISSTIENVFQPKSGQEAART